MSATEKDYQEWARLANDPAQSEEARLAYRQKMSDFLHDQLRSAFEQRSAQVDSESQSR